MSNLSLCGICLFYQLLINFKFLHFRKCEVQKRGKGRKKFISEAIENKTEKFVREAYSKDHNNHNLKEVREFVASELKTECEERGQGDSYHFPSDKTIRNFASSIGASTKRKGLHYDHSI